MLWPIINCHFLLLRLHLMSCDYLLALAGPASQLFSLPCISFIVVVCCFWGGQVALWGFHLNLSCLVCCYCCWRERAFEGMGSASLSCVVFPLHSFSCTCLLLLGLTGCLFRGNSRWRGKSFLKQPCTSCVSLLLFVSGLERFLSKQALADNQLSPSSFTFTFDVLSLSTCCCWARFSTAAFALQSSSCGCLLFLGWTGCSFRDYSMRQRFFQVA